MLRKKREPCWLEQSFLLPELLKVRNVSYKLNLWSGDWLWENGRLSLIQQCLQSNSGASANYPLTEWIKYWGPGNNHVLLRV